MQRQDVYVLLFLSGLIVVSVSAGIGGVLLFTDVNKDTSGTVVTVPETPNSSIATSVYNSTEPSIVSLRVETPEGAAVQGSGFVYTNKGHIITNQHVVENANKIYVLFSNGTYTEASVVGTDVYTDVAVIKSETLPNHIKPLAIRKTLPNIGETVFSIGTPSGLRDSMTTGIVSGTERAGRTETGFTVPDMIQTDAALNPGNSGGPLLDENGYVVGVSRARQGENIGFAISGRLVALVSESLIENGEHNHPYVGIATVDITPEIASSRGLDATRGLLIQSVVSDGPSSGTLEPATAKVDENNGSETVEYVGGDIILAVDKYPVYSNEDLGRYLMLNKRPGEQVTFTVLRNGTRKKVTTTLGKRPSLGE